MSAVPVRIRDATTADLPRIVAILNEAIVHTTAVWSLEPTTVEARTRWLLDRQAKGQPVLVATTFPGTSPGISLDTTPSDSPGRGPGDDGPEGQVLGFATYGDFRPFAGYLHTVENSLYVDEAARGHGIGGTLLAALLDRARSARLHVMIAGIEASNLTSINLHQRFGFTETGRLPQVGRKFDRWLDLVFLQKILD